SERFGFDEIASPAFLFGGNDRHVQSCAQFVHQGFVVTASAADDPGFGAFGEMFSGARDCGGGEGSECGGAVFGGEVFDVGHAEIETVKGFGAGLGEEVVLQHALQHFVVDLAFGGECAVFVYRFAGVAVRPIVYGRVARTGVEGHDRFAIDIGDVGDAADVHDGSRLFKFRAAD